MAFKNELHNIRDPVFFVAAFFRSLAKLSGESFFQRCSASDLRILEEKCQQITSGQDLAVHLKNDTPHTRNKSTKGQTVNHRVYIFVFLRVITIQAQIALLRLKLSSLSTMR